MKIAVLMGGTSSEREVSLRSGAAVAEALKAAGGFEVVPVVLENDSLDALPDDIRLVYIALHGGYGENGGVQADLDRRRIKYTGPGARASRVAMDKAETKRVLLASGIPTAPFEILPRGTNTTTLALPVVVKPPRDGSSVGVSKVTERAQWDEAVKTARAADADGDVMVEQYIPGREMTVSVVGGKALPVIEIKARGGWYGYTEKYTSGMTEYLFPEAAEDASLLARVQKIAVQTFQALGLRGVSRVDFRVTPEGEPFVLEVNTVPGCTATSLLPKAAAKAGIPFPQLCAQIAQLATYGE